MATQVEQRQVPARLYPHGITPLPRDGSCPWFGRICLSVWISSQLRLALPRQVLPVRRGEHGLPGALSRRPSTTSWKPSPSLGLVGSWLWADSHQPALSPR